MKHPFLAGVMAMLFGFSFLPDAEATIIRVPHDQPTIQSAINASSNGDTVLADEGVFAESINFNGRRILVASVFLVSGDTSSLERTVIRGYGATSVVTFAGGEDSTAVLCGFTITQGYNGGIFCQNSSPVLRNLIVTNNAGRGGVYCSNAHPKIMDSRLIGNLCQYSSGGGGGLWCVDADPTVTNTVIENNTSWLYGGGVFCSNSHPTLTGVIIMNNTADDEGGGVYCRNSSSPIIRDATISGNTSANGGGIACKRSDPVLINVTIESNIARDYYGGGVYCEGSAHPSLTDVLITRNQVQSSVGTGTGGGGMACLDTSRPSLSHVTISRNAARVEGGGMYFERKSSAGFDPVHRCSIYMNEADVGFDLYLGYPSIDTLAVVVDTFTVMIPREDQAAPIAHYTFDILHAKKSQDHSTLYVSQEGDNDNTGLSWASPLRSIAFAKSILYASSQTQGRIFVAPGTYSRETNGERFELSLGSWITLRGSGVTNTMVRGDRESGILSLDAATRDSVENLTLTHGGYGFGGAIFCSGSSLVLRNIAIRDCHSSEGGAISASFSSHVRLENALLCNDTATSRGGSLDGYFSNYDLENVTIANNTSPLGGGIYCQGSQVNAVNSILWQNSVSQVYQQGGCSITVSHSDFQNGQGGIIGGVVYWLQGNEQDDPSFVHSDSGDYHLSNRSTCIGAGADSISIGGTWFMSPHEDIEQALRPNPSGSHPDIGAYENQHAVPTSVAAGKGNSGTAPTMGQNYPNPFNPTTEVRFEIGGAGFVSLKVYDMLGREVATLVNEIKPPGTYTVRFDGSGLPSGVYFYRLDAGRFTSVRRMVLLK